MNNGVEGFLKAQNKPVSLATRDAAKAIEFKDIENSFAAISEQFTSQNDRSAATPIDSHKLEPTVFLTNNPPFRLLKLDYTNNTQQKNKRKEKLL